MRLFLASSAALLAVLTASIGLAAAPPAPTPAVDFHREVRPILSRHCFKCHGPDDQQRMGKLRLDLRESAVRAAASGKRAVVPGKPEQSELVHRVFTTEAGRVMPPQSTKNPLSEAEKLVLKRWVASGAEYRQHWAFVPPKPAPVPAVKLKTWPRNPIDNFILARLEAAGLKPSPQADRHTLVRRVYLDLIGLPPTPEEADQFVNDRAPDAYEKLVDRLLASPHYGERWARRWLDLARYADTNGYEKDRPRSIWPYRDWVIDALNADMPFDQFTIEQLAGDMLPNTTPRQRIATGFHRNTMLNEEGGIDPLEYRFHAMTDRVSTTATTWLGLTVGCAQCHTHKYDPIPHREYYQFMAFLNNADEPEMPVELPVAAARRAELEKQIAAIEADLPNRFPPDGEFRWAVPPASVTAASGARAERVPDGSVRLSGANPERDTYTIEIDSDLDGVTALRLEALPDPSLGGNGPGRTPHGNFVLSELSATVAPRGAPGSAQPVKLTRAVADFSQDTFPVGNAIDGNLATGWAIHGPGAWNVQRTATFFLEKPLDLSGGARWTIRLEQQHGMQHTLGRFRVSLGQPTSDGRSLEVRRREHRDRKFNEWLERESASAVRWTVLRPATAKSNLPLLTVQEDGSVLSSGDQTKRDVYDLTFRTDLRGITAVRLEALPDDRLPRRGPGRIFYEGPHGDFFLSEVTLSAGGATVPLSGASQSFGSSAKGATDGNPQTGWSVNGGQGQAHTAVFNLAKPLDAAGELSLRLLFEQYYAAGMGRFRVSVTTDPRVAGARLPADVEALLTVPAAQRTAAQHDRLLRHFLSTAPEMAAEREAIRRLREQMPQHPTTLVFAERPAENPRATYRYHRGEFLQPKEKVTPAGLSVLHPLPAGAPANRLTFARWLVDPRNPLVGRVTMNRQWAAFFGKGLVRTTEDFGFQGETPSHPELLDWLALQFTGISNDEFQMTNSGVRKLGIRNSKLGIRNSRPWSLKAMHRLIVTSATYQQSSRVTPQLAARDPQNRLLGRAPRFRLEAELLRDSALQISGLLAPKLGGPSVFPPQPAGVTSEGTYGPLQWKVSEGPDRYRRGLYTFAKRTAPYAMFTTFDAPTGEACVARREVSNTPLQALTLLNDMVFVETAQALGRRAAADQGSAEARATLLFRRVLTRPPTADELPLLVRFYETQKGRLAGKGAEAASIAGAGDGDAAERAAWTLLARSLLNLDEAVVKE